MFGHAGLVGPLVTAPRACQAWLQRADISSQLAALGYEPQQLQEVAAEYLEAMEAVEDRSTDAAVVVPAMLHKLHALGLAFTSLALTEACNNPSCCNLSGLKEKSLVCGKSCVCGGCRVAHYCCSQCQNMHWNQHRPVCKALKNAKKRADKA